jgi:hypothetical protein
MIGVPLLFLLEVVGSARSAKVLCSLEKTQFVRRTVLTAAGRYVLFGLGGASLYPGQSADVRASSRSFTRLDFVKWNEPRSLSGSLFHRERPRLASTKKRIGCVPDSQSYSACHERIV